VRDCARRFAPDFSRRKTQVFDFDSAAAFLSYSPPMAFASKLTFFDKLAARSLHYPVPRVAPPGAALPNVVKCKLRKVAHEPVIKIAQVVAAPCRVKLLQYRQFDSRSFRIGHNSSRQRSATSFQLSVIVSLMEASRFLKRLLSRAEGLKLIAERSLTIRSRAIVVG
jgi:hypothetical protein